MTFFFVCVYMCIYIYIYKMYVYIIHKDKKERGK